MTAKIIQFRPPKKDTQSPNDAKGKSVPKTPREIFQDVTDDVLTEWRAAAIGNRLSEYIASKIPPTARVGTNADYVNDLNVLSRVEQKIGIAPAIFGPGCTANNPIGWGAAFFIEREIFNTPPDMASESIARALNVVLFATYHKTLKTLNKD